ncbi:dTDP-4-dehydrorhamnose reductase [Micromonospora sp. NPDC048871]|uniref:dTDP-4-dehydrorhamnose reductase n=1 Tax=unclassified Micromonospora TaxID=2617518 RepID=UPI002E11D81A|nr:dTDP-4-dehydrorhamnose reductase [Micromonospora sp. NBC_01739]
MRILVTGAGGMLGRDIVEVLTGHPEHTVTAVTRTQLDLTDAAAVNDTVAGHDVVLNAAGWTDVDRAEQEEAAATAVNGTAVTQLASACATHHAHLLHISTDYVFAGDADTPYREDSPTAPVNAYGRSKLVGEQAVRRLLPDTGHVVRTAWLYGAHGRNFVTTMIDLADQREFLNVVDDQRGQPTWSYALARQLVALAEAARSGRAPAGIWHGTCSGQTTWYGLARAVFALRGLDPDRVRPTTSSRFPRPATRPAYSVLGHGRWAEAGLSPLPNWHTTLVEAFTSAAPPSPWKVA